MALKHYTFMDYATQAYCCLATALILLFHNGTVPNWGWLVAANLAATRLELLIRRVSAGFGVELVLQPLGR